jgi:hypothetical protein
MTMSRMTRVKTQVPSKVREAQLLAQEANALRTSVLTRANSSGVPLPKNKNASEELVGETVPRQPVRAHHLAPCCPAVVQSHGRAQCEQTGGTAAVMIDWRFGPSTRAGLGRALAVAVRLWIALSS